MIKNDFQTIKEYNVIKYEEKLLLMIDILELYDEFKSEVEIKEINEEISNENAVELLEQGKEYFEKEMELLENSIKELSVRIKLTNDLEKLLDENLEEEVKDKIKKLFKELSL